MNTIYKLFFALGLLVTGGEMATRGDEHTASIQKMAEPLFEDGVTIKRISENAAENSNVLPDGVVWIEEGR